MIMHEQLIVGLLSLLLIATSHATTDQERSALQRLHDELLTISTIIVEAEQNSNKSNRNLVDYNQLRSDLKSIQQGVDDILYSRRRESHSLPPIKGDYR